MVTRREVLKGTAAVSIGAIAAAHGAAPAEAASLDLGYGQLTGGVIGGFIKLPDAYQIALKFQKAAVELFYKDQPAGGVGAFIKVFDKQWITEELAPIDSKHFLDLKMADLYFSKFHAGGVDFFLKLLGDNGEYLEFPYVTGEIGLSKGEDGDAVFYKFNVVEID